MYNYVYIYIDTTIYTYIYIYMYYMNPFRWDLLLGPETCPRRIDRRERFPQNMTWSWENTRTKNPPFLICLAIEHNKKKWEQLTWGLHLDMNQVVRSYRRSPYKVDLGLSQIWPWWTKKLTGVEMFALFCRDSVDNNKTWRLGRFRHRSLNESTVPGCCGVRCNMVCDQYYTYVYIRYIALHCVTWRDITYS